VGVLESFVELERLDQKYPWFDDVTFDRSVFDESVRARRQEKVDLVIRATGHT